MDKKIIVGMMGLGTVGGGVAKVLLNFKDKVEIKRISVKEIATAQKIEGISDDILTEDTGLLVNDPEMQIFIEVAGGIEPAFTFIKQAIENGKHIVTANKELIAKKGEELFELAKKHNVVIMYEAAVAGGIPIIMPLKTSLAGNKIQRVAGILNGTTNYILTKMAYEGGEYEDVLKEAQALGYAEADPTGDVQGFDALYKISIVASLAFNKRADLNKIYREGIDKISTVDIAYAREFGYKIKLVAMAQEAEDGRIDVRVHPTLLPENHLLANINGVLNAVVVDGDAVNRVMFTGPGAGELPTASSVVGDILAIANELNTTDYPLPMMRCKHDEVAEHLDISETKNKYYIRVTTSNIPGVLGELGLICGKNNISLYNIIQKGVLEDGTARIVLLTELAYEKDIKNAIKEISDRDTTKEIANVIRVME